MGAVPRALLVSEYPLYFQVYRVSRAFPLSTYLPC